MQEYRWQSPNNATLKQVLLQLEEFFDVELTHENAVSYQMIQDSGWQLWQNQCVLLRSNQQDCLLYDGKNEFIQPIKGKLPMFHWDLPKGDVQERISAKIGYRAMLEVATAKFAQKSVNLRNEDAKIVCRLELLQKVDTQKVDTQKVEEPSQSDDDTFLSIQPLKGYKSESKRVIQVCTDELIKRERAATIVSLMSSLVDRSHIKGPSQYGITSNEKAELAVREMTYQVFAEAQSYETGIIKDVDSEFLHDYRIALRKARSIISLMKSTLEEDDYVTLKNHLADLARPTNNLRDLDVFILDEATYRALLPEEFGTGLDRLFDNLKKERARAQKDVARFLLSADYKAKQAQLYDELAQKPSYTTANSTQAIIKLAKNKILKRYQRIRELGLDITDQTPDEEVHQLRIECKKLRYLMSFFAELFPKKQLKGLRRPLTRLQNTLGKFNDYSVQITFLQDHTKGRHAQDLIVAVSGLIAVLHQKQIEQKAMVTDVFQAFGSKETASAYKKVFS